MKKCFGLLSLFSAAILFQNCGGSFQAADVTSGQNGQATFDSNSTSMQDPNLDPNFGMGTASVNAAALALSALQAPGCAYKGANYPHGYRRAPLAVSNYDSLCDAGVWIAAPIAPQISLPATSVDICYLITLNSNNAKWADTYEANHCGNHPIGSYKNITPNYSRAGVAPYTATVNVRSIPLRSPFGTSIPVSVPYRIDFGDGTLVAGVTTAKEVINHVYNRPGVYMISATTSSPQATQVSFIIYVQ